MPLHRIEGLGFLNVFCRVLLDELEGVVQGVDVVRLLDGVAGERQFCFGCFCEGEVHKGIPNLRVDLQRRLKRSCTLVGQFSPSLGQVEVSIGKRVSS